MIFQLRPIGLIHSPFKEKFGVPRQPGIATAAKAELQLLPPYDREEALEGLEGFSHLWILFYFHVTAERGWRPTVRPPRLGGNARVGVFASRSTHRPNPIGLSAVRLEGWGRENGRLLLRLRGADLVDGTPVLDIKPYLPYADSIPQARGGFAEQAPAARLRVVYTEPALAAVQARSAAYPELKTLIEQVLAADPRPAYRQRRASARQYGMRLLDFDLRWRVEGDEVVVEELVEVRGEG